MLPELEYLERARKEVGLNTSEFVRLLPLHRTTYYGWLRGREPDKLRLALCMARIKKLLAERRAG